MQDGGEEGTCGGQKNLNGYGFTHPRNAVELMLRLLRSDACIIKERDVRSGGFIWQGNGPFTETHYRVTNVRDFSADEALGKKYGNTRLGVGGLIRAELEVSEEASLNCGKESLGILGNVKECTLGYFNFPSGCVKKYTNNPPKLVKTFTIVRYASFDDKLSTQVTRGFTPDLMDIPYFGQVPDSITVELSGVKPGDVTRFTESLIKAKETVKHVKHIAKFLLCSDGGNVFDFLLYPEMSAHQSNRTMVDVLRKAKRLILSSITDGKVTLFRTMLTDVPAKKNDLRKADLVTLWWEDRGAGKRLNSMWFAHEDENKWLLSSFPDRDTNTDTNTKPRCLILPAERATVVHKQVLCRGERCDLH